MLDPKFLRSSVEAVAQNLSKRGFAFDTSKFTHMEEQRKSFQMRMQELQNARNVRSKEVGRAKAKGEDVTHALSDLKALSDELKQTEEAFNEVQTALDELLAGLPNLTHDTVPTGQSEADNVEIRRIGEPKKFNYKPKDHVELGAINGWIDFETAAKLAGARFVVLRGPLARLNRALIQFMLNLHVEEHNYQEIYVPSIANAECLFGTGQLPKFKEDLFAISGESERYLISTSEIAVTNTVREQIIEAAELPLKYVCYSPCFRSEAGSYGKDMRGMLRQHQFEKVELVQIVKPEHSYEALEEITSHAETVLKRLELPYRVVSLCTGDIGFAAAKTYDLEVWLPGQDRYREISSCSNTESFQARRMKARWRDETGNIEYVHTLNGSGLAIGRTLIAVVENYQDELGRIHIPSVLQPYMNGLKVIE